VLLTGFSEDQPREWQSKVVRFGKLYDLLAATTGSVSTCVAEGFVLS
jgi:hypothetical protein